MTVEQRVSHHDGQGSQRKKEALTVDSESLSENGQKVKESLTGVLESYRENKPDLVGRLLVEISHYPANLFNHLGLLLESPVFKAQEGQKGHWAYELTMIDRTLACADEIQVFLDNDKHIIEDLMFMIVTGDIGKSGPVLVDSDPHSKVVSRIYNQAIFHRTHQRWLQTCDPSSFPSELDPAMAQISKSEPEGGGLSAWDLIFKNGTFIGLPIEVYLYVLKQVALSELGGNPAQAEALFSLRQEEKDFLIKQGFDPVSVPIRKFFTSSHIQFGQSFLQNEEGLDFQQKSSVILAMAHHLSQGELPAGFSVDSVLADERQIKICAYLEILDKVDAVYHRSNLKTVEGQTAEEARQEAIETAVSITQTEVLSNLLKNFAQYPQLVEIYKQMLAAMKKAGVFNFA